MQALAPFQLTEGGKRVLVTLSRAVQDLTAWQALSGLRIIPQTSTALAQQATSAAAFIVSPAMIRVLDYGSFGAVSAHCTRSD